jgi:predicted ATPase
MGRLGTAEEVADVIAFIASPRAHWARVARGSRLAHLLSAHGRGDGARDLLVPVYGWFLEGFDTPDLQEAKALLRALDI